MGPHGNTSSGHTSAQTPAAAGPLAQIWPAAAAWAWFLPWTRMAAQSTQMGMASIVAWHLDTNMAAVGGPQPGHSCRFW